jgi:hypothetical protein
MKRALAALALVLLIGGSAAQDREPVGIELVLALDSSASIDDSEFALQIAGLSAAFRDPDVLEAVAAMRPLGAAVAVMQWGGPGESKVVIPWTRLDSGRDAKAFAHMIGVIQRWQRTSSTSIATALDDGRQLLETNNLEGQRRVIDVSGDGIDNGGLNLAAARNRALAAGITVNGLAIEIEDLNLAEYYRQRVIGGVGSFVERASDFEDFARAIKAKLLRELRPLQS